jgi:hypothetical protein
MHAMIRADDGDELSVSACSLSQEQGIVRLELDNRCHGEGPEFDWITLSVDQARDLAHALLEAAERAERPPEPSN